MSTNTENSKTGLRRKAGKPKMDSEVIYQRIQTGIRERRLLPGAKLAEKRLAEVTGVSRTKIRQVLARLAHEQVVTLVPNRGAFIARPSVKEAREMFETRRLIEPSLVARLCREATPEDIAVLRAHVAKEQSARENNDLRSIIRLSGEFHVRLVDMVATGIQRRLIRELTALTCLIITLYDKPSAPACPHNEHAELVRLIEAGDETGAHEHMLSHLLHIERTLDLDGELEAAPDLEAIFAH